MSEATTTVDVLTPSHRSPTDGAPIYTRHTFMIPQSISVEFGRRTDAVIESLMRAEAGADSNDDVEITVPRARVAGVSSWSLPEWGDTTEDHAKAQWLAENVNTAGSEIIMLLFSEWKSGSDRVFAAHEVIEHLNAREVTNGAGRQYTPTSMRALTGALNKYARRVCRRPVYHNLAGGYVINEGFARMLDNPFPE